MMRELKVVWWVLVGALVLAAVLFGPPRVQEKAAAGLVVGAVFGGGVCLLAKDQ